MEQQQLILIKDEDINAVIDINAKGTIYFTREVAKVMAEQKVEL